MSTPVEICSEKFGGIAEFAKAIGLPYNTIVTWKNRHGFIPAKYQATVLRTAQEHEIELEPSDVIHWGA